MSEDAQAVLVTALRMLAKNADVPPQLGWKDWTRAFADLLEMA